MNNLRLVVLTALFSAIAMQGFAQNTVRWSGMLYMDYEYLVSSSLEDEGENGFEYRRLYLTADYVLSDEFSGRARLEAASEPEISHPFVKDLYLTWKGAAGEGHDLVFGVQSPPLFTLSERHWGYRSLEKTIMDRQKVASSRDMGISASGTLAAGGDLTYSVMVGNNNGIRGEDDKYKRAYGQLAWQSDLLMASAGGDYAAGDDRNAVGANAFAGYSAGAFRIGVEGFFQQIDFDGSQVSTEKMGISGWLVKRVNDRLELVGRVDYAETDFGGSSVGETFLIGGVAFSPNPKVHLIPNAYLVDTTGRDDPEIAGRVTLHADF